MPSKIVKFLFVAMFIIAWSLMSCNADEPVVNPKVDIASVEELDEIIENCRESELETRNEIENNLIGEWQLVGLRSGWVNQFEKKDIVLSITDELIILNDKDVGTVFQTEWQLDFVEVNSYQYYYLSTAEEGFNNRLGMESFCNQFMSGSGRVDDGNTYVYQKVE